MNRKNFLQTASTGVLAASLLPLLSFTNNRTSALSKSTFKSNKDTNINSEMWYFEFSIDNAALSDFNNANNQERKITILALNSEDKELKLFYTATSLNKKTVDSKDLHFFNCKLEKGEMTKDAKNFADESFGKNINIEVHRKCHAVVRDSNLKLAVSFKYSDIDDAYNDCFLTSATVFHKGFSDDCKELTILRNLREKVMKPNPNYSSLISEYGIIAPKMLLNINAAANKDEILESIYENLILPSVSFVESGKNIKAIEHYTDFVYQMKKLYL